MTPQIPPGPGRGPVDGAGACRHPKRQQEDSCEWCGVVLLVAVIAGCYVAGFGYSGWLAIAIGLHVWLLGFLLIRHQARPSLHTKPE